MKKTLPSISVVTPTLNAEAVLDECLKCIDKQDYPKELVEIVIADGGSTDKTIAIAKKYGAKIYHNKLKTAESGKAVGVKNATNEIIALIDSDNFLPNDQWFRQMIKPFIDNENIFGTEPIRYTYRKKDPLITRYSALIGMNDPLVLFTGNYDRYNYLTGKWTQSLHEETDKGDYLEITLNPKDLPTIGANGTMIRSNILQEKIKSMDYLFDIDIIYELVKEGNAKFAKIKNGIIHVFCRNTYFFIKKQQRRVKDFLFYKKLNIRTYPWGGISFLRLIYFSLFSLLIVPTFIQSLIGFIKKPDVAWFFHPVACFITFWIYAWETIKSKFGKVTIADRSKYKQ